MARVPDLRRCLVRWRRGRSGRSRSNSCTCGRLVFLEYGVHPLGVAWPLPQGEWATSSLMIVADGEAWERPSPLRRPHLIEAEAWANE